MEHDSDVRRYRANRTRSLLTLVYGVPFGLTLIGLLWLASRWLPIPDALLLALVAIQLLSALVHAINIAYYSHKIRHLVGDLENQDVS